MNRNSRALHVGSLLRPNDLLQAQKSYLEGSIIPDELACIEEASIIKALKLQRDSGIEIYTDGEYLRSDFMSQLTSNSDGFVNTPPTLEWNGDDDTKNEDATILNLIGGKLKYRNRFTQREVNLLQKHTKKTDFKISMPDITNFMVANWQEDISKGAYPSRYDILDDLGAILVEEAKALIADGVYHVQIDAPCFISFANPQLLGVFRVEGLDPDILLHKCIEINQKIISTLRQGGVFVGMHICRGNYRGQWFNEGSYHNIAEKVFGQLTVDQWLLEYDTERAGSFDPIMNIPHSASVVLGLVTTKNGQLENMDDLASKINEASKFFPLNRMAISPQCGFASEKQGNPLTWDDQRRKLDLVVSTADLVWR